MIKINVKLYSILWLAYRKDNDYDLEKGIALEVVKGSTILDICEILKLDTKKVISFSLNGEINNDLNQELNDGDIVGLYPTTPMGG